MQNPRRLENWTDDDLASFIEVNNQKLIESLFTRLTSQKLLMAFDKKQSNRPMEHKRTFKLSQTNRFGSVKLDFFNIR